MAEQREVVDCCQYYGKKMRRAERAELSVGNHGRATRGGGLLPVLREEDAPGGESGAQCGQPWPSNARWWTAASTTGRRCAGQRERSSVWATMAEQREVVDCCQYYGKKMRRAER